ncbi:hypothetical protein ACU5EH_24380 [Aliivibrio salmonicida]|uniref:hypothetical protein n=1 Tax=Aliivibrio salmonicida TaxID=40269 RepID=UPI00406D49ED
MSKHYAFEFLATRQWALEGEFLDRMVSVALREGLNLLVHWKQRTVEKSLK